MRWHRRDYLEHLLGGSSGREMFVELFGPLVGLEDEWHAQGATPGEIALTAFDWDYVEREILPIHLGPVTGLQPEVIEEDDEYQVTLDALGRRMRLPKGRATIALPETYPMSGPEDWPRVKAWFRFHPERVDAAGIKRSATRQRAGAVLRVTMPGAYATMRDLMGDENACLAFIETPDLVAEVMETLGELCEGAIARVPADVVPDELFVHEDFAGRSGPIIGPAMFREFVAPYYQRVWAAWSARGTRIFDIDSDGFIEPVLDALLDSGINCTHPLEPAAGMDTVRLRRRYGRRLILRGGIDKFSLQRGRSAIEAELEYKMQPAMRGGGVMFGLDHRIPNGTPLEAYRYYVAAGRRILGLPPLSGASAGWARMA